MNAALLTMTLLLASCVPAGQSASLAPEQPVGIAAPQDAAACLRSGGAMKPGGRLQTLQCVQSYADAGKSCRDGSQCAGDCRTAPGIDVRPGQQVAGQCQATSDRFGCSTTVENGRAQTTVCID